MNTKENWINEVESSLNGLQPAEVNPYLYAKIINRLNSVKSDYAPAKLIWATLASMVILLFLNIVAANNTQPQPANTAELQQLATQYQLTNTNFINYN